MMNEREIIFRGQKIYTESIGSPSQSPILLICGAGAHARFWTDTFCERLAQSGYFVIRYDHRDVGLSGASDHPYEINDLVNDAIEILNGYNLSKAHIVGHSMGGYIVQLLGATYPERILSLTIISAGPVGLTTALEAPQTDEEKRILYETWSAMLRNRPTQEFEESWEGFLGVWRRLNGTFPIDEAIARSYTQGLYVRSNHRIGAHERHLQVMQKVANTLKERADIFSKIKAPTLIIHGEEDYLMLPKRGGEDLAKQLPHAQLVLIPQMGHMFFHQELEAQIVDHITSFIQSVENT